MNQPSAIDDPAREWLDAREAAARLGVKRQTLYAYASRGLLRSVADPASRERRYARDDIERLKARSGARAGHGAVAAGALRWGEPVLETRIGTLDARGPIYRGIPALTLIEDGASFEDVCTLLWQSPWQALEAPTFGARVGPLRAALGSEPESFDAMILLASSLAIHEPRAEALEVARRRAPALIRRLIAACATARGTTAVTASLEANGVARALLLALGGRPTKVAVSAVERALILAADHELNASTFTARVTASAGANLAACVLAALATLSGPRHGRETARVEAFLAGIERPDRATAAVAQRLDRGESIPGFGHPLYPDGDPRGRAALQIAGSLAPRSTRVRTAQAVADAMNLRAREQPTLDLGLVALAGALGLPDGSALSMFACGRLAGWIAHVFEQREADFLLRPRARYVGS